MTTPDLDPWTDPEVVANNQAVMAGKGSRGVVWSELFPQEERLPSYPEEVIVGD